MMRRFILLTLCLTLFATLSNAQEICNNNLDDDGDGLVDCRDGDCVSKVCEICDNGIDDDGDYFIDCYDKECTLNSACQDFFLGRDVACDVKPESFPPFQMKLKFKSDPGLTNHLSSIVAGDVDNDGIPELVTAYRNSATAATLATVNILQAPAAGTTLVMEKSIDMRAISNLQPTYEDIAMADINRDGCAEIFVLTTTGDGLNYKIIAYDCNGTPIWTNPISFTFYPGLMGLADFDGDGFVELYVRTQIFDAHSGTLMGQNLFNNDPAQNSNGPVAVDILSTSPGLELVAGCRIYAVTINRPSPPPAIPPSASAVTLVKQRTEYFTRRARTSSSATSIADFNQDGHLDVLAVGSTVNSATNANQNTTVYFWDVEHDELKTFIDIGTLDYANGWKNGASRINVADIDGDTLMNAVYVSGKYLYALKEGSSGLELLWKENVIDETSGFTGVTTFDFNGDGRVEIVYRDEDYLYLYNMDTDGVVTRSVPVRCSSRTYNESPIVADMDGDGSAELCVTCSTTNTISGKNLTFWDAAEVRVYESANEPWVPARKVWNQHGYFGVNVNDDLTIPRVQQLHHLVYAKKPAGGNIRPLNSFQNQIPFLNAQGLLSFPAPNVSPVPASSTHTVDYTPFTCMADSVQVTFKYKNLGDVSFKGTLQISFYDGDPRLSTPIATRLATKTILVWDMNPEDTITMTTIVKYPGSAFDLYVVLNDDGTTVPLDFSSQPGHIRECDYDNVMNARITPDPVVIVPEIIRDNLKCLTVPGVPVTPDNGAVKASVSVGGVSDNINFNFYWSIGAVPKPIGSADYMGPVVTNLGGGAYTVYAVHKAVTCSSDPVTLVVNEVGFQVDARVILEKEFDNSENPNGELRVVVNDGNNDGVGDPHGNFNYSWYNGQEVLVGDTIGINHILTGLGAGTYSVLVLDKASDCYDSAYATIPVIENVLGTDQDAGITGVSMYPNPGTAGFTILIDNGYRGDVQLQIQSALGNEIDRTFSTHKGARTLKLPVDTSKFKSGVYLVKISLGDKTQVRKWIKL